MPAPTTEVEITITRGDDLDFRIEFSEEDEAGVVTPVDLTGATWALFEPHPALVGNLTAAIDPVPTTGGVDMQFTWDDADPPPSGREMTFYLRLTFPGGRRKSSEMIRFYVK
jgi:hypothetical protein